MNRLLTALTLSCTLAAVNVGAFGQASPKDPKLGTKVTIRGCLHEGTAPNSFVLLNMTERPATQEEVENVIVPVPPPAQAPRVPLPIYWLDSTKGLKERVGQIIDITGEVREKQTKAGTITISIDPSEFESKEVTLATGSKEVTTEKFRPVGRTPPASTVVLPRQSYLLSVERVHTVTVPPAGTACK